MNSLSCLQEDDKMIDLESRLSANVPQDESHISNFTDKDKLPIFLFLLLLLLLVLPSCRSTPAPMEKEGEWGDEWAPYGSHSNSLLGMF